MGFAIRGRKKGERGGVPAFPDYIKGVGHGGWENDRMAGEYEAFFKALAEAEGLRPALKQVVRRPVGPCRTNFNNCARFLMVLEGRKRLFFVDADGQQRELTLSPGEVVFGVPGNCFWDAWDTPHRMLSMVFPPRLLRLVMVEHDGGPVHRLSSAAIGTNTTISGAGWLARYLHLEWGGEPVAPGILKALVTLAEAEPEAGAVGGDELLLALLKNLRHRLASAPSAGIGLHSRAEQLWRSVNDLLDMEFTQGLTREYVAAHFRSHPDHLTRLFRQHGDGFNAAILRRRLELACRLLQERRLGIAEIAYQAGFSSPSYFTRCFFQYYHTSPGKWRGMV